MRFVTIQLVGVHKAGVTRVGEVVVGRTVQVQLNVYSADAQAHSNQAIVEAVAVCHEDVQAKFDKLEWVEEAVQLGILSNKEVIAAVAASFWKVNLAANILHAVNLFGSVVGKVSASAVASVINCELL